MAQCDGSVQGQETVPSRSQLTARAFVEDPKVPVGSACFRTHMALAGPRVAVRSTHAAAQEVLGDAVTGGAQAAQAMGPLPLADASRTARDASLQAALRETCVREERKKFGAGNVTQMGAVSCSHSR